VTKSLVKPDDNALESQRELDRDFAKFLRIDVANGDASPDTIRGYCTHVAGWVSWCKSQGILPAHDKSEDVKAYRRDLARAHYKRAIQFVSSSKRKFDYKVGPLLALRGFPYN
jgi:hypothetical protein